MVIYRSVVRSVANPATKPATTPEFNTVEKPIAPLAYSA